MFVEPRVRSGVGLASHQALLGFDLVAAAESHLSLFNRMRDYLHGEPVDTTWFTLEAQSVSCELGEWMENEGKARFGQLPSFVRLCERHAEFHYYAEAVLEKIRSGSWIAAEQMRKQEFSQSLRRVLIMLTELNEDIRALSC